MLNFFFRANTSMQFGEWLKQTRVAKGLSQERLAEQASASGWSVTASYISNLERAYDTNRAGKPIRPSTQVVDSLAFALGVPVDEARLAAGYAPERITTKPRNLAELIVALEDLGLPVPQLAGGWEKLVDDSGGFEEALERIKLDLQMVMDRMERGHSRRQVTYMESPVSDVDLEDELQPSRVLDRKTG